MLTVFEVLSPQDYLNRSIKLTLSSNQKDFPVLDGADVVAVLTQSYNREAIHEY